MIARVHAATCLGIQAVPVEIEVDVANGLPQFSLVGLPDASIREARERVRSAIHNSGFRFPPEKITVNLAPADLKKEGPAFDLAIALGILAASGQIPNDKLASLAFFGELALDGSLRPFRGALVISQALYRELEFVMPETNAIEGALESRAVVYQARSLGEVVKCLRGESSLRHAETTELSKQKKEETPGPDFSEIKGQPLARRAAELAAAGAHNILFIGSPGSGKTMISHRMTSVLPELSHEETLEVTKIQSLVGLTSTAVPLIRHPPFRNPHHSVSAAAIAGGGGWPRPGEVSLAHGGVLFLDELPEFRRDVLETLRAPLEEGRILISRAKRQVEYPCRFMLVAAMNPCPCGWLYDTRKSCRCSLAQIQKYQSRVSGPILDRIDLHVEVPAVSYTTLLKEDSAESSAVIRKRVTRCRQLQARRYPDRTFKVNALMRPREIKQHALPDSDGKRLLERAMKELGLSARAYYKILKLGRTLADLEAVRGEEKLPENDPVVRAHHIAEAIQYRALDRQW